MSENDTIGIGDRVRAVDAIGFKGTVKAVDLEAGQAWVRWDYARGNVTENLLDLERHDQIAA